MTSISMDAIATLPNEDHHRSAESASDKDVIETDYKDVIGTPSKRSITHHGEETSFRTDGQDVSEPISPKDVAKTRNSDLFTVLAAGCALVSDGYQNNVQTMLNVLFGKRYGKTVYNSTVSTRVSNALLVGAIIGQISVGIICDRFGRKTAILFATALLTIGAVFTTAASPIDNSTSNLFWWLTITRGVVGYGVGAEYPASSTSASEAANEKYGRKQRSTVFILCTNLVLSLGGPLAVSFFCIVLRISGYGNTTSAQDVRRLDIVWRVCYGFGAMLPLIVLYFRWKILNSKLYRAGAIRRNVPYWLALKRYWPRLIGTCLTWFLYDIVAFGSGVFSATVIATVEKNPTLLRTGEFQLLLGAIALPGAILGAFAVRYLGTKYLLIAGFAGYIIIGLIVGLAWEKVTKIPVLFVILYGLLASFGNIGPGSCLGLVSSESYPTALRGTAYGISAALGKVGGVSGVQIFQPVENNLGKKFVFIIAACVGVLGCLISFFFVPDTTKFDLAAEDEKWRQYLIANGWDGFMGDGTVPQHKASDIVGSNALQQDDEEDTSIGEEHGPFTPGQPH